jgi:hypothetical protein
MSGVLIERAKTDQLGMDPACLPPYCPIVAGSPAERYRRLRESTCLRRPMAPYRVGECMLRIVGSHRTVVKFPGRTILAPVIIEIVGEQPHFPPNRQSRSPVIPRSSRRPSSPCGTFAIGQLIAHSSTVADVSTLSPFRSLPPGAHGQ